MGYTTCGLHRRRTCWRCDRCPTCEPKTGRLGKGDYCKACSSALLGNGYVWSNYCQNYVKRDDCPQAELIGQPFNLAGELIDNSTTAEGEARARAQSQAEADHQQRQLFERDHAPEHFECGGTFDGFSCGTDADPGL